jgi:hypothetical protein
MDIVRGVLVVGATLLAAACGPDVPPSAEGTDATSNTGGSADSGVDDTGSLHQRQPFRDDWRVEADLDFLHVDPATGVPQIYTLAIGGRETMDNFANRGDVIVNFDGPANRILIELRRFTFTTDAESAEGDFDHLHLWAFTSQLGRPQDQDPADDCVSSGWQNACSIRVYYDGISQLERSGADIRVTLPADYRQTVTVVTEDNVEEQSYLNRGNVCIGNLLGSADVETESGNVWASLADDATPAPKCTAEQIQACEEWTVEDRSGMQIPAPWAPECDCIAVGGGEFGRLAIVNREGSASNVMVDVPAGLWASIRAENQGELQNVAGEHCEASITVPNFEPSQTGNDFPWEAFGSASYPGEPAILGAGYSGQATSSTCGPVAFTEDPEDFVGEHNGDAQAVGERGNIEVCTGCIVESCDMLVP